MRRISRSAYEVAKAAALISNAISKIQRVLERIEENDVKNAVLLTQALSNLMKAHEKLLDQSLRSLKGLSGKRRGINSNGGNFKP